MIAGLIEKKMGYLPEASCMMPAIFLIELVATSFIY